MSFQPTWYTKISHTYADYKKGDILIAKDVDEKGAKNFAFFPNTQTLEKYINESTEKHFYDCYYFSSKENIRNYPVKLAFDIDINGIELSYDDKQFIVVDIFYKVQYELSQYYNITIADTDFVVLDSSGLKDDGTYKTSFHIVLNGYHFTNVKFLEMFIKFHLKTLFNDKGYGLDNSIYGSNHFLRLAGCSKKGSSRVLILQTEHSFQDTLAGYVDLNTSVLIDIKPKKENEIKEKQNITINREQINKIEKCILENLQLFESYTDDYYKWISIGIKLYQADCRLEIFKEVSKLSSKYDEQVCEKKWESFSNYEKNVDNLLLLFSSLGICLNDVTVLNNNKMGVNNNISKMGVENDFEAAEVVFSNYPSWKCYNYQMKITQLIQD